jgi:hypothetical protein
MFSYYGTGRLTSASEGRVKNFDFSLFGAGGGGGKFGGAGGMVEGDRGAGEIDGAYPNVGSKITSVRREFETRQFRSAF